MKAFYFSLIILAAATQHATAVEMTNQGFTVVNKTASSTYSISVAGSPDTIELAPGKSYKIENLPTTGVTINGSQLNKLFFDKQKCGSDAGASYCLNIFDRQ
ncbi:hypothetical protein [Pseudomonas sp. PD9R]|uniref:hypothetical protein n=1 Tax=Pseudomonas sp. PD9R TaxID=2853534 RepID=UPI001C48C20C|nr:hypothetical protein [Pseudomonas sp. PD9R]MBV6822870.1 hypothetical protein [Pseudomonas sp. PD9R]